MPVESIPAEITCNECHTSRKTKLTAAANLRTPMGWHKQNDAVYCEDCWHKRYLLRAVSIPIAEPIGCTWEDIRQETKMLWRETTQASNWIMTELYARDIRRGPTDEKMPAMGKQYLYPELRVRFPDLPSQTVASIEQAVQKKYRSIRYRVIWTCSDALPTFKYPVPVPVHNQSWSVRIEKDRPIVRFGFPTAREVRLKAGPQFRRQYTAVRQIARGEAVAGEAAIYQRGKRLMLKMVAWLPRAMSHTPVEATLSVTTGKESLLTAVNIKDEKLWSYNGDHVRRWSAEHRRQLQRWSEDAKYEDRPVPAFADRRKAAAAKYRDRMNDATHKIAAELAGYALRRRFAEVRYDDTVREYCEGFPWFRLRALMREKLEAFGIGFTAIGPTETKEPEPLAEQ